MTEASSPFNKFPSISVVVTNYNGRALLERCLPSIEAAAKSYTGRTEIILVDDCSTDASREYVYEFFPKVNVYKPNRNLGFQGASNFGFQRAKHSIVVSLNNDIEVSSECFTQFAAHFSDPENFSVSAKLLMWDRTTYLSGRRKGIFESGHLKLLDEEGDGTVTPTLFSTGGACAFDREKLLALGGFDPVFHPLYWEDIDLCYRAWKRGWKVIYDPRIVLYHKHRATIEALVEPEKLREITARNSYLFLWKNLSDPAAIVSHLFYLPVWLVRDVVNRRWRFPIGFLMALMRLPQICKARIQEKGQRRRSDEEILNLHLVR